MNDLVAGAAGAVLCGLAGLLMPRVVARLPEPPPEAPPEEGVEPSAAERERREEPPKELYAAMAVRRRLSAILGLWSAIAGAVLGWSLGWDWVLLMVLPVVPVGATLAVIDLRTRLLPSVLVRAATVWVVVYAVVAWPVQGDHQPLVRGVVGLVLATVFFFVLWFVYPRGMGYGDVRLAGLTGFVLAYAGWAEFAVGIYSPFLIFGLPGVALALVRRDLSLLKKAYPFGPFLLVGAVLGIVLGGPIIDGLVN